MWLLTPEIKNALIMAKRYLRIQEESSVNRFAYENNNFDLFIHWLYSLVLQNISSYCVGLPFSFLKILILL
jgi:hypothetical protein